MSERELAALLNLGPASARWLVGAATANLLYALYAAQRTRTGPK
jgi:hypothetical protein